MGMKLRKSVVVFVALALVFSVVPAMAAKNIDLFEKGINMMLSARDTMKGGVDTVEKGMAQYVQICTGKGCLTDVDKGNEVINKGLAQAKQGMALLDQGQKEFQVCKANRNLEGEYRCLDTFVEGGRMVQDGLKSIEGGMRSNNDALRAKGLDKDTSAPSTMVNKGVESGLTGMKAFLAGQKLAMENR
jgi:molybdopterin-binding protein